MKREMFEELLDSVREAGSILRGEKKPSRRVVIRASGVRSIRERTKLSQSEFARLIGVSVKTLSELGTGPAASSRTGSRAVEDHRTRSAVGSESDSSGIAAGLSGLPSHRTSGTFSFWSGPQI